MGPRRPPVPGGAQPFSFGRALGANACLTPGQAGPDTVQGGHPTIPRGAPTGHGHVASRTHKTPSDSDGFPCSCLGAVRANPVVARPIKRDNETHEQTFVNKTRQGDMLYVIPTPGF